MKKLSLLFTGICIVFCPLFYSSCEEDKNHLPPTTMDGRNTFGCLVNGQLFLAKAPLGQTGIHAEISKYPDTVGVIIYAGNFVSNKALLISIYESPAIQTGKSYDLKDARFHVEYTSYSTISNVCIYEDVQSGDLTFSKVDLTKKIISGIFRFEISSPDCKDSLSITEGRFDIGEIII